MLAERYSRMKSLKRNPLRIIWRALDWLDDIEVAVITFGAAVLAVVLLVVGPLFLTHRFVLAHHYAAAFFVGLLWISCAAGCIRDYRRRSFSWVSGGLIVIWTATALLLILILGISL
jgi:hypothetical protein